MVHPDTGAFTEHFVTPEVEFRYERGGAAAWQDTSHSGATRVLRITGPDLPGVAPDLPGGPSYVMTVSWYRLAPEPSLAAWAARHADAEHDDEAEEIAEKGGPPVPSAATTPDTLHGRPGLKSILSNPDEQSASRYFLAGPWVIVFRYTYDTPNEDSTHSFTRGPRALLERMTWVRN